MRQKKLKHAERTGENEKQLKFPEDSQNESGVKQTLVLEGGNERWVWNRRSGR